MQRSVRVLVSSCGRRVQLIQGIRQAFEEVGLEGEIITADAGTTAPAAQFSDEHHRVPRIDHPAYLEVFASLCADRSVDLVVPTIDTELAVFAQMRPRFLEAGTTIVVSDPEAVSIASDKRLTHRWLDGLGVRCPEQWDLIDSLPDASSFPVIVKPAAGSMSAGIEVVHDLERLKAVSSIAHGQAIVAEKMVSGSEYTVSTYVDGHGRCMAAVPRRRLEVRAGEVSKAMTVRNEAIEQVAAQVVSALPGARGPLNVQLFHDEETGQVTVIEINARYGGGDPLAWRAGANAPRWMLQEFLGLEPGPVWQWEAGLLMLRFDDATYVSTVSAHDND